MAGPEASKEATLRAAGVVLMLPPFNNIAATSDAIDRIAHAIDAATAAEREACAKLADDGEQNQRKTALHSLKWGAPEDTANHRYMAERHAEVAAAIRKRGEVNTAHKSKIED